VTDAAQPAAPATQAQPAANAEAPAAPATPAVEAPKTEAKQEPQKPIVRVFARKSAAPATETKPAAEPAKSKSAIGDGALTRMRNKLDVAERAASEALAMKDELAQYAKKELNAAPEAMRKFVLGEHKDDPRAQLALLRKLTDAGAFARTSPIAEPAANTAPPKAPAADATDPDVQLAKQYETLANNPAMYLAANAFLAKHRAEIKRGQQKLSAKN
jgi:hypothetical protein